MSVKRAKAHVAVESKRDKRRGAAAPSQSLQEARRALAEENIKAYVEKVVAGAPELSTEARSRLAAIFRSAPTTAEQQRPVTRQDASSDPDSQLTNDLARR